MPEVPYKYEPVICYVCGEIGPIWEIAAEIGWKCGCGKRKVCKTVMPKKSERVVLSDGGTSKGHSGGGRSKRFGSKKVGGGYDWRYWLP